MGVIKDIIEIRQKLLDMKAEIDSLKKEIAELRRKLDGVEYWGD